jgi:hypothetical protein
MVIWTHKCINPQHIYIPLGYLHSPALFEQHTPFTAKSRSTHEEDMQNVLKLEADIRHDVD